jgi:hypothetical protein
VQEEVEVVAQEEVEVVAQGEVEVVAQEEAELAQAEAVNKPVGEDRILQNALDQAASSVALVTETSSNHNLTTDYDRWLNAKLQQSRDWLIQARNEWPLDLSETYLYEVNTQGRGIYRVFYSEFDSLSRGRSQLERLPESVKRNSPYLHSVYRMQKALL